MHKKTDTLKMAPVSAFYNVAMSLAFTRVFKRNTNMATTYPAGHATVAGCNQMILSYFFPPEALGLQRNDLRRILDGACHGDLVIIRFSPGFRAEVRFLMK
jgi:hypothetical protein